MCDTALAIQKEKLPIWKGQLAPSRPLSMGMPIASGWLPITRLADDMVIKLSTLIKDHPWRSWIPSKPFLLHQVCNGLFCLGINMGTVISGHPVDTSMMVKVWKNLSLPFTIAFQGPERSVAMSLHGSIYVSLMGTLPIPCTPLLAFWQASQCFTCFLICTNIPGQV